MINKLVRIGVTASGVAVLAIAGTSVAAGARSAVDSAVRPSSAVVLQQEPSATPATPAAPSPASTTTQAAYEPEMSDEEIARYLAAFPLEEVAASEVTPVFEGADDPANIDPDTGCLTREAAAAAGTSDGADEAAIQIGTDLEFPNCWDLVNYLRRHPID